MKRWLGWRPGLHAVFYDLDGNAMQIYGDADPNFTADLDPDKEHYPLLSSRKPAREHASHCAQK